ncbi:hypothetical protein [Levilactobacillus andaensis]|uniref:hypothetical protein n=1 Tax=Levilactobacillus andaensis TaxID=2799570 RepID=UPI0019454E1C|nr:hypothetical protein [Levilactobacillus andaensis]
MGESNQDPAPKNVSAEQFNALSQKVDSLAGLPEQLKGLTDTIKGLTATSQPTPPAPKQDPEPPTPKEPTELGGFTLDQIQAMAAENKANAEKSRQTALESAAKENGITLDDSLSAMILNSSKTPEDIATNIKSLAGLKTSEQPNPDPGFNPDSNHTSKGAFNEALTASFGENNKEKE